MGGSGGFPAHLPTRPTEERWYSATQSSSIETSLHLARRVNVDCNADMKMESHLLVRVTQDQNFNDTSSAG